jgi:hypothetical protein
MHARQTPFLTRLLPPLSASVALWALLLSVPVVMRWENGMQRIVGKVLYPSYKRNSGAGTHGEPYVMMRLFEVAKVEEPFVVAMGEDTDKIFDSNPLSSSDCAVLLDAMKKEGAGKVMIAAPLAWQAADPFALEALDQVMAGLPGCVTSAAVGRGAQEENMPPALQRASVPVARVVGTSATVPVVNRLTIDGTFLGRETTWAGFSEIESEAKVPGQSCLIARWGDRVIFSSSLLAVLLREDVHPEELVIEPGQAIHSPRTGHWWEIDVYGRGKEIPSLAAPPDLQAAQFIRPEPEDLAKLQRHRPPAHLLTQAGDGALMQQQRRELHSLYMSPRLLDRVSWRRLPMAWELAIVALLAWQAVLVIGFSRRGKCFATLLLIGLWLFALRNGATWIPLAPGLLAFAVAYATRRKMPVTIAATEPVVSIEPAPPVKETVAAPKTPRKQAKKAARKKKK